MSTPKKPDPARGWLYVEKLLEEELEEKEVERIKNLSDDEVRAEIWEGVAPEDRENPGKEWSADELLARAEAIAKAEAEAARLPRSGEKEPQGQTARKDGAHRDLTWPPPPSTP
jgi:hypothetical protein